MGGVREWKVRLRLSWNVSHLLIKNKMVLSGIPGAVIDRITKELGLQTAVEGTNFDLLQTIQPIIEMKEEKFVNIVKSLTATAGGGTIHTTSSTEDTYIISAFISHSKVAADSNTNSTLSITPKGGVADKILSIAGTTLTDENDSVSVSFPVPILLERGSLVTLGKVAANGNTIAGIQGYTVSR